MSACSGGADLPRDTAFRGVSPTPEDFARAISPRREELRWYPSEANETASADWSKITQGVPVAVYLADRGRYRCTAFDLDGPGASADAGHLSALLAQAGVRHVVTESGGAKGGRHVLATWDPPIDYRRVRRLAVAASGLIKSLDIGPLTNPATGCIRPPLAAHRCGGRSAPLGDPAEALDALQRGNDSNALDRFEALLGVYLSPTVWLIVENGYTAAGARFTSGSEARFSVIRSCINAGWPDERIVPLIESGPLGRRPNGAAHTREFLLNECHRARAKAVMAPTIIDRDDALARIRAARVQILGDGCRWRGAAGATDRAVYRAHLDIAERCGRVAHGASSREVAELAGIADLKTVRRSRLRLSAGGMLKRKRVDYEVGDASTWEIVLDGVRLYPHLDTPPQGAMDMGASRYVHDAFRRGRGLGLSALKVRDTLATCGPLTVREMATAFALGAPAIRRHLRVLERHGLIQKLGQTFHVTERNLDEVAAELGAAGIGERQRRRHQQERVAFKRLIPTIETRRRAHRHLGGRYNDP